LQLNAAIVGRAFASGSKLIDGALLFCCIFLPLRRSHAEHLAHRLLSQPVLSIQWPIKFLLANGVRANSKT
jgi:hypothetical protein